ncbi:MAG: hypothetical protein JWM39_483 [Parcubacteria group bacterium]|nr:hypothetical protein [Parcubacteria group bacterium]
MAKPTSLRARLLAGASSTLGFLKRQSIQFANYMGPRLKRAAAWIAKQFKNPTGGSSLVEPKLYWGTIVANIGALLVAAIFFHQVWYLFAVIGILQFLLSVGKAGNQEIVNVVLFDIAVAEPHTGAFVALYPWMGTLRAPNLPQQYQFPDEPERVYNGDDKDPLPPGMMRAYRVTSGGPKASYKGLLNIQMSASVTGTVRFRINHLMAFWTSLAGHTAEEKFAEARRQLYDTWSNAIVEEYQKRPIGLVIEKTASEITSAVRADLERATATWGITFLEVTIRSPNLGHDLSGKLAGIGEALAEQVAGNRRADTLAYATRQAGEAEGAADLSRRKAEADGAAYEAEKLGIDGIHVFAARAAKDIIGPNDKFFFGADAMANALGVGISAAKGLIGISDAKKGETTDAS